MVFTLSCVLFVGHFFHPVYDFTVEVLLDRDMGHSRKGSGAMPVPLARRKPNDITRMEFFNRAAFALRPATAGCHDESLPERMSMPGGSGAGFKSHTRSGGAGGSFGHEQRIDTDRAGEPFCRPLTRRLEADTFDLHGMLF
jgi:hypothetical protein